MRLAFTTDSFVVPPLFFPGGNIGDLAVNGTVNDLAVSGARPLYSRQDLFLKRGSQWRTCSGLCTRWLPLPARLAWPLLPAIPKWCNGAKLTDASSTRLGWGVLERPVSLGAANVQPGDAVLVSGPIGDHGITIMLARAELDIVSDITSDTAPLTDLVACLLNATPDVRCLRDATRRCGHHPE